VRDFYWRLVKSSFPVFWEAIKRGDTVASILTAVLTVTGLSWILRFIPLWMPVSVLGLLFLYGLLRANYEAFREVEDAWQELGAKLATAEKRKAINDLLGGALEEGLSLKQGRMYALECENQNLEEIEIGDEYQARYDNEVRAWVDRTYQLINDAFGKAEAQRFVSNEGYTDEDLFGRELPSFVHLSSTERQYLIPARLRRLDKIIDRANSLEINPDFDARSAAQEAGESVAARLRLEAVAEQRNEENEKLKADILQLTVERDALEREGRKLKDELDGQIRGRCIELTDELDGFLTQNRAIPPEETMRLYGEQLRGKVDRLRADLMRLGWWTPREDVKRELEYPETPDHLLSIYHYVRNIGLDMPFK
jgi:hypothetical protein